MPIASLQRVRLDHDAHRSGRLDAHQQGRSATERNERIQPLIFNHHIERRGIHTKAELYWSLFPHVDELLRQVSRGSVCVKASSRTPIVGPPAREQVIELQAGELKQDENSSLGTIDVTGLGLQCGDVSVPSEC
jgi:hypothetical protein